MFSAEFNKFNPREVRDKIYSCGPADAERSIGSELKTADDIYPLFSPAADGFLEEMARRSASITRQRFGNTIQLYAPLYISNECSNACAYCGFSSQNDIARVTLTMDQRAAEAAALRAMGFRHALLLTGEDRKAVPPEDIAATVREFKKIFSSVSIEVYPMEEGEYSLMIDSGADGLTLYQETYDRTVYSDVHPSGKKRDFEYRLGGPDRGGAAGFRRIGIGALLGLADWRVDGFFTAIHALYLSKKYWRSQINLSFPRMRQAQGGFKPLIEVDDRALAHLICAARIILPDSGLALSTREPAELRDNILPLGITMMSAGSKTDPGGYTGKLHAVGQFDIEDIRTPAEISNVLKAKGFDPVWKDWDRGLS